MERLENETRSPHSYIIGSDGTDKRLNEMTQSFVFVLVHMHDNFPLPSARLEIRGGINSVSAIIRDRVCESRFWKEKCFSLDADTILNRGKDLDCVGILYGASSRPTEFLCLLLKLLQIRPPIDIIQAYLLFSEGYPTNNAQHQSRDLRYFRALVALYVRLTATSYTVYTLLEPLYSDFRTLSTIFPSGDFGTISMDEMIEQLLDSRQSNFLGLNIPFITTRYTLEDKQLIRRFKSKLNDENLVF